MKKFTRRVCLALAVCCLFCACRALAVDVKSDLWTATDALGRSLPGYKECGPPRSGKYVGIFYFLWLGQHGTGGPYDITKILAANPTNPAWGPETAFHHWHESELGYYLSNDSYVMKKHARMLADAGVDVLIIDVTNAFTYKQNYTTLCSALETLRGQGDKVPQICFITNSSSDTVVQTLYSDFYSKNLYPDTWFRWLGKPLILASPGNLPQNIKDFFTFRQSWAWHDPNGWFGTGQDKWPWLDHYPQAYGWHVPGVPEEVSVCVAQHPTTNIGRSFQNGVQPSPANFRSAEGLCFAEQWNRALAVDPEFIYITGWNEWVAQRFISDGTAPFLGGILPAGGTFFVDAYTQEYSRDIEPMKGGHTDNYYYQMIGNIRKFKGVRPPEAASAPKTISINGSFSDWTDVGPEFIDHPYDTETRDTPGWGSAGTYTNNTGRNDFIVLKVARDTDYIYFYAQTRSNITSYLGFNWMFLFIDSDCNPSTGWNGYDYLINHSRTSTTTTVKRCTGGWNWTSVGTASYKLSGSRLEMAIPRSYLGLNAGTDALFDFHWADNIQKSDDIIEFAVSGDSAPDRRANYRYNTAPDSVSGLQAIPGDLQVRLEWTNPSNADFTGLIIRYKTDGFPASPDDGTLLVDRTGTPGAAESYVHTPVSADKVYYYSVFSYDTNYVFSQAATVSTRPTGGVIITQSTFDTGPDGWETSVWRSGSYSYGTMGWVSGAGNPGGAIRCTGAGASDNDDRATREGGEIRKTISTAGFTNIKIYYDLRVGPGGLAWSGLGRGSAAVDHNDIQEQLTIFYSTNGGQTWAEANPWLGRSTLLSYHPNYGSRQVDLSGIPGVDNNPQFALRFRWQLNNAPESGDHADLDNIIVASGVSAVGSISDIRKLSDGSNLSADGKILYLKESSFGYVEDENRSSGIRIKGALSGNEGDRVSFIGKLLSEPTGERFIDVWAMNSNGAYNLKPLGMNNKTLLEQAIDGLYITAWGRVKNGSVTGNSFIITDGSDSTGIRVITSSAPGVTEGSYVSVTGAAGFDGGRVIYRR